MKILYYDCFAGISGDMNLGAMIDLGVDKEFLIKELKKLNIDGYKIEVVEETKQGISGTKVTVRVKNHTESNLHHSQTHHHGHRNLNDIRNIIMRSKLNEMVKKKSLEIFEKIGFAESKIHNKSIEEIHFHEVGAIDSIIDIVGCAICIDYLKPDKIMSSTIELGGGFVTCEHGVFPVPAPATAEILKGLPVKSGAVMQETTTPTGAAILATFVEEFTDNTKFVIQKTGYGIGQKEFEIPNLLRVYIAEESKQDQTSSNTSLMVECNIDDMNPELYDYIFDSLFKAGASDVFITPVIMKKSRPAVTLSILCNPNIEREIERILFKETSTLGIRKYLVEKTMLERKIKLVETPLGMVQIKLAFYKGRLLKFKPEYEDCLKIAKDKKIPLSEVYTIVNESWMKSGLHHAE